MSDLVVDFLCNGFGDVSEPTRDVDTVAHFGERRFSDVQEMQPVTSLSACKSFYDIRGNGEGGTAHL